MWRKFIKKQNFKASLNDAAIGRRKRRTGIEAGNVVDNPAGAGHKCLTASKDFSVIGAYPDGKAYDIKKKLEGENIKKADNCPLNIIA